MDFLSTLNVMGFLIGVVGFAIAIYQTVVMRHQSEEMQRFTDLARDWGTDILEKTSAEATWLKDLSDDIRKMDAVKWKGSQESIGNEVTQRQKAMHGLKDSIERYLKRTIQDAERVRSHSHSTTDVETTAPSGESLKNPIPERQKWKPTRG